MPSKPPPQTPAAFFAAIRTLTADLEAAGQTEAAAELREGSGLLNGLTDGWALLLDAVTRAFLLCSGDHAALRQRLGELEAEVYRVVYRRPIWPWTKFFRLQGTSRQ